MRHSPRTLRARGTLIFLGLIFFASVAQATEIAVIVSPSSGLSRLSQADIKAIFLGKMSSLPAGGNIEPINQAKARVREVFDRHLLEKSPEQLEAYWAQRIFSGKGTPPMVLADDEAVKQYVRQNPDSIGYIDASRVDSTVKVVLRISD